MSQTHGPEYWWVSVGGSPAEPATMVRRPFQRAGQTKETEHVVAYTAGCADPFFVDDADCPMKLIEEIGDAPHVEAPEYVAVPSRFHGYQKFQRHAWSR